ncbi:universal stress protein [Intrasporangium sp.]|uniref:universal stress protein n=1 Tax=Intrasporangium sp. TaxID=1925024 RepID=UPI003221FFC1
MSEPFDNEVRGIVVGWDASEGAKIALDWAADSALRQGLHLTVLHCLDVYWGPGLSAVDPAGDFATAEGVAAPARSSTAGSSILRAGMERAKTVLGEGRVSGVHAFGTPAGQLVEASRQADYVVTGSRGRGRVLSGLLGSTSYAVTAHAHCPAIVVRTATEDGARPPHPGPDSRVLVGIDGSPESAKALEQAADIASRSRAPLHVVAVARVTTPELETYFDPQEKGRRDRQARERTQEWLDEARRILEVTQPALSVRYEVLSGSPGHTLADLGFDAGLVVVGSRGRGGFSGLLLGSVSHTIIHEALCPVMIVH